MSITVTLATMSATDTVRLLVHKGRLWILPSLLCVRSRYVLVTRDAQDFEIPADSATTLVPGNDVICLTLFPI